MDAVMDGLSISDVQIRDLSLIAKNRSIIKSRFEFSEPRMYYGLVVWENQIGVFTADLEGCFQMFVPTSSAMSSLVGSNLRLWYPECSFKSYFYMFDEASVAVGRVRR